MTAGDTLFLCTYTHALLISFYGETLAFPPLGTYPK